MKSRAGFTLPEMMVAMAVGSLMLGGLMVTSTNLQRWFAAADFTIGIQQDEATVLDYLARDIRRASAVAVQNGDRKLVLTLPDQTSRAADGSLNLPALSSAALQYGAHAATVSYYVQGNALLREDDAGPVVLSSNLDEFHSDLSQPPAVQVQLLFRPAPRRSTGTSVTANIVRRNPSGRVQ